MVLIVIFAVSTYFIATNQIESKEQKEIFNDIVSVIETESNNDDDKLNGYMELKSQNADFIGWIKIDDTNINYPVMQSSTPNFYLKKNFNKEYSDYGTPYISELCNVDKSDNMSNLRIIEKSFIGDIPICELNEMQIDMFLRSLTHYSNSTIGKVFLQLKMAYREACNRDIIQKNIMFSNNLRCPKSDKPDKKVKALTRSEQAKFVAFLQNYKGQKNRNDYSRQLLIELFTGMRMGEINALTPECVDFEKGVIHIRSTVARGEHFRDFIKNGTKTDAGVRDVPIMKTLEPILKEAINKKSDNPLNLIFYDEQKNGIISTSQVNCFYKRVCEKCGIEKRGQHSLRHTFATRCIEANVPAIVLKKWLGHTDIHITLDTYADVFDSMNNDSIIKVDDYIVNLAG